MNGYAKYFDSNNKYMNFLVHDKKLLKRYNGIWDKISYLLKKDFHSEPVYNDKYIKAKINILNTNFPGNKIPEENEDHACLSVILLDSVGKVSGEYYPQIFECKYAVKKKNIINAINEKLNLDESDDDEKNNENYACILMVFHFFMDLIVCYQRIAYAIKSIKFMYFGFSDQKMG